MFGGLCKAEGTGFEPATGKPATDFESASNCETPSENATSEQGASYALPSDLAECIQAIAEPGQWIELLACLTPSEQERELQRLRLKYSK